MRRAWSVERARRLSHSKLRKIEQLLIEFGGLWGDEDEYLVGVADGLMLAVRDAHHEIDASIEAARQRRADEAAEPSAS